MATLSTPDGSDVELCRWRLVFEFTGARETWGLDDDVDVMAGLLACSRGVKIIESMLGGQMIHMTFGRDDDPRPDGRCLSQKMWLDRPEYGGDRALRCERLAGHKGEHSAHFSKNGWTWWED